MSKLPIFELIISGGNLKPKLKWFFKLKLKTIFFLLNFHPDILNLLGGDDDPGERGHRIADRVLPRINDFAQFQSALEC